MTQVTNVRELLSFPDNNGTGELVVPPLFPLIQPDPKDPQTEGKEGDKIAEIATDHLPTAGNFSGGRIDNHRRENHLARCRLPGDPEHDNGERRQYP